MGAICLEDDDSLGSFLSAEHHEVDRFVLSNVVINLDDACNVIKAQAGHSHKLRTQRVVIFAREALVVVLGKLFTNV